MDPANDLPALIDRASRCLMDARSSGEFLEARNIAQAALHYAKVTNAANETHADCLRIIVRAETRMADAVDKGQATGQISTRKDNQHVQPSDKLASLDEIGVPRQRLADWRALRDAGPDAVEAAIQQQLNEGRAPTKAGIQAALAGLTGNNEWYTPAEWIERARAVMGSIDCDPATNEFAQQTVRAGRWYDKARDGLQQRWRGNVWLNPPYARGQINDFIEKLCAERRTSPSTETPLMRHCLSATPELPTASSRTVSNSIGNPPPPFTTRPRPSGFSRKRAIPTASMQATTIATRPSRTLARRCSTTSEQWASELDHKKRAATLDKIQQLVHERAIYAPIGQFAVLEGVGPRVGESGLGRIAGFAYTAPYEDITIKGG